MTIQDLMGVISFAVTCIRFGIAIGKYFSEKK